MRSMLAVPTTDDASSSIRHLFAFFFEEDLSSFALSPETSTSFLLSDETKIAFIVEDSLIDAKHLMVSWKHIIMKSETKENKLVK